MNPKKIMLFAVTCLCLCLNARGGEQAPPGAGSAESNALSSRIKAFVIEQRLPGMVLMIAKDRKILLHEAYGYADLEHQRPLHRDDIFRLHSMSKPITAAAVMKLVEQKRLRLDTPLHAILPEFAGQLPITIAQLLTHTAGFPYDGRIPTENGSHYRLADLLKDNHTLRQMTSKLAALPLPHAPGTKWVYGMSSDIQGAVIEKLSGMPLEQFLQESLLRPLAMHDTAFFIDDARARRLVSHYRKNREDGAVQRIDEGVRFRRAPTLASGGGGLVGNAADYMRFLQMLLHPQEYGHVLAPAYIHAIRTNQLPPNIPAIPQSIYPQTGFGFGLGVKLVDDQYLRKGSIYWAGKGGTLFWADPGRGLAVVALMQIEGGRVELEQRLIPWVNTWLHEYESKATSSRATEE